MEDIVAVAVELDNGARRYFITWGRIQNAVDPEPLEQLILQHCTDWDLGGEPVKAHMCGSLQEASHEPYFYECFFSISQQTIPFGDQYASWKAEMNKSMYAGKELYYLGNPDRFQPKSV